MIRVANEIVLRGVKKDFQQPYTLCDAQINYNTHKVKKGFVNISEI